MSKRVFISFNYNQRNYKDNLVGFFQGYGGRIPATPVLLNEDVSLAS